MEKLSNSGSVQNNIIKVYTDSINKGESVNSQCLFYSSEIEKIPEEYRKNSFGCANPLKYLTLGKGAKILDVGCGAGLDMSICAQTTGEKGIVAGFDLTFAMVKKGEEIRKKAEIQQLYFSNADAENIPYKSNVFDAVISNAVIHLTSDKQKVYGEIFRVLKMGGMFSISDIYTSLPLPEELRQEYLSSEGLFLYGGILSEEEYLNKIYEGGFYELDIQDRKEIQVLPQIRAWISTNKKFSNKLRKTLLAKMEKIRFYVSTIVGIKTENPHLVEFRCRTCDKNFTTEHREIMNVTVEPRLKQWILEDKINQICCPYCKTRGHFLKPVIFHDMKRHLMIHIFPEAMRIQRKIIEEMVESEIAPAKSQGAILQNELFFSMDELKNYLKKIL